MRVFTKLSLKDQERMFRNKEIPKHKAGWPSNATIRRVTGSNVVMPGQFKLQTWKAQSNQIKSRLCGDLGGLSEHLASFAKPAAKVKYGKKCEWCGEDAFTQCLVCGAAQHFYPTTGGNKGKGCVIHYHNGMCFRLGFKDHQGLRKKVKTTWVEPTLHSKSKNRQHIIALKQGRSSVIHSCYIYEQLVYVCMFDLA
jgi:hypothetical protein